MGLFSDGFTSRNKRERQREKSTRYDTWSSFEILTWSVRNIYGCYNGFFASVDIITRKHRNTFKGDLVEIQYQK